MLSWTDWRLDFSTLRGEWRSITDTQHHNHLPCTVASQVCARSPVHLETASATGRLKTRDALGSLSVLASPTKCSQTAIQPWTTTAGSSRSSGAPHPCGDSNLVFVQLLELAFASLPLLVTEALRTTGYCYLYSSWDLPGVTGICCSGLQSMGTHPATPQSQRAHHPEEQKRFRQGQENHKWISLFIQGEVGFFYQKQKRTPFALSKYLPVSLPPNILCIEQ